MTDITAGSSLPTRKRVGRAVYQHGAFSRAGLSERLFALLFSGLVYPQIFPHHNRGEQIQSGTIDWGRDKSKGWLKILDENLIGPRNAYLCGDQVTIVGSGFQPGKTQAEVRFGRRKADNVIIASATEITVVTPPGDRGPIDVSVMFEDGKAFKIPDGFRFVAPGDPTAVRKAWEKQNEEK